MTMNRIIPVVGILVLLMAAGVGLRACGSKPQAAAPMAELPQAPAPDADTPADTVRTLSAQVAELLDSTKTLAQENRALREQNQGLVAQQRHDEERIRTQVQQELTKRGNVEGSLLSALTERVDRLSTQLGVKQPGTTSGAAGHGGTWSDVPVGFGHSGNDVAQVFGVHWIEPLDAPDATAGAARKLDERGGALLDAADTATDSFQARVRSRAESVGERALAEPVPVYTIPSNATLTGSTTFSALVGRVPVGGQVQDPMPFKVLIGAPNLAANGHEIPGLQGMVMSGYAIGDWTLSCVRGRITSATFVFEDGRIVTFGGKDQEHGAGGSGRRSDEDALGWISDRFGVPCVSGKRITNAPEFLAQRVGVTALQAAAEAAAASETTTTLSTDTGVSTSTVTGDVGAYALGRAVSGGASEISKWLLERQAQSFDAVFVAAGEEVVVHVDVTLPIDRDPAGRRLDHRLATGKGGIHGALD